ncbi:MAG: hypothetical protein HY849_04240 [Nitrosomonadales bacterium]|nr:hypothetical protein [Nitrosomonadales bacterium]
MATVIFYEKPGCGGNAKQKVWLAASGHTVLARDLLTEPWTAERLRAFFGAMPVAHWFNLSAPRVKSGEVDPAAYSETEALALLLAEPLLIRRPLLEVASERRCGFDPKAVDAWIGLDESKDKNEPCPICHRSEPCPPPAEAAP